MNNNGSPSPAKMLALRLDDVGACSKRYEVYSNRSWGHGPFWVSANWLFLKRLKPFRAWGVYREMEPADWEAVFRVLDDRGARLTVAVTAAWADSETRLTPFPRKFPEEAGILRQGVQAGLIEIANHGLTHCVLAGNAFKPKWFSSNRNQHREFWDWIGPEIQERHLKQSQQILQDYFQTEVVTLVPPGNVFARHTLEIAAANGIRYLSCHTATRREGGLTIIGDEWCFACHDRDVVLNGPAWFESAVDSLTGPRLVLVREAGEALEAVLQEEGRC